MGFRALKKALEAPYTTKVNNRERTTRGTTPSHLRTLSEATLAAIRADIALDLSLYQRAYWACTGIGFERVCVQ